MELIRIPPSSTQTGYRSVGEIIGAIAMASDLLATGWKALDEENRRMLVNLIHNNVRELERRFHNSDR
jgi:hypothetical protein